MKLKIVFIMALMACMLFAVGGIAGAMEHGRDNRESKPLAPPQNLRVINEQSRPVGQETRQETGEQKTQKPRGYYGDGKGQKARQGEQKQGCPQGQQQRDRQQDKDQLHKDRQQPKGQGASGRKGGN